MHIHIYIAVVFLLVAVFLLNFGAKNERENWEEDYRLKSIPVPGKWFEEYKAICYSYYPKHDRLPQSQEDCYDTSFVYTDDMNRLVKSSEKYGKYPGCAQVTQRTNYCYSTPSGEYVPDYAQVFYDGP